MALLTRKMQVDLTKIRTSSKMSLRLSCVEACGNDLKAADELYRYIAEGIELPDVEPQRATTLEQIKRGADDVLGWIAEHKDTLVQGYQAIQSLRPRPAAPPVDVPPIPKP